MYDTEQLIQELNGSFGWELARGLRPEELEELLAENLNRWILTDFNALLQFLYRIDISETRVRSLLKEEPNEDAGRLLAKLVLERQWQKMQTRQQFRSGDASSDEERW
ncbi:hypothetical protein [Puia dinghuensis]|uniref:Uncharacterized protein n=1 Tax=Puia dinghuensis TaxID=1792502 RepID=A0A8J2UFB0_9BACT|nr:hypothetical protein [Puia dinghuensis]GGB09739.1 hypothetical protein GCM10011511_36590 [Puia dinghuensis]